MPCNHIESHMLDISVKQPCHLAPMIISGLDILIKMNMLFGTHVNKKINNLVTTIHQLELNSSNILV